LKRVLYGVSLAVGVVMSLMGIYSVAVAVVSGALLGPRVVWLQLIGYLALGYVGLLLWRFGQRGWASLRRAEGRGAVVGPPDYSGEGEEPVDP
jgi:hypothetical protein